MKKFVKWFVIILLVIATIAGTCYFFYKKLNKKQDSSASLGAFINSNEKQDFEDELNLVNADLLESGDRRIEFLAVVNKNLDDITKVLSEYFIIDNENINDKEIVDSINKVSSERSKCFSMVKEYQIKRREKPDLFPKSKGANDLFEQMNVYLSEYAKLTKLINEQIDIYSVNKMTDPKFFAFDIYANIVVETCKTETMAGLVEIKDKTNLEKANTVFEDYGIKDSYWKAKNPFGEETVWFGENYSACDKEKFATEFSSLFDSSRVYASSMSYEGKAMFYFLKVCGVI